MYETLMKVEQNMYVQYLKRYNTFMIFLSEEFRRLTVYRKVLMQSICIMQYIKDCLFVSVVKDLSKCVYIIITKELLKCFSFFVVIVTWKIIYFSHVIICFLLKHCFLLMRNALYYQCIIKDFTFHIFINRTI